jgi:hypothetical protein
MLRAFSRCCAHRLPLQGGGLALVAAALGWLLVLIAGIAHGLGGLSADTTLALLLYLFLLPLVTGATSHLLPVWRWPGAVTGCAWPDARAADGLRRPACRRVPGERVVGGS